WLPVPDDGGGAAAEQVSTAPTHTTFRVQSDAPVVTLDWTDPSSTMTRTTVVQQGGPAVDNVVCTLDGVLTACFDAGDAWVLDQLSDGQHDLVMLTRDDSGNHTTSSLAFRVGDPPAPEVGTGGDTGAGTAIVRNSGTGGSLGDPAAGDDPTRDTTP